jgi:hypothetical protein
MSEFPAADEVLYNAADDFSKSIDVAYRAVRARVALGGPPWVPKDDVGSEVGRSARPVQVSP